MMINAAWAVTKVNVAMNSNIFDSLLDASLVVKITVLILLSLSVVCWAIFFSKHRQLSLIKESNVPFLSFFWKATSLDRIQEHLGDYPYSPLARIFNSGYLELQKIVDSALVEKSGNSMRLMGMDNLERAIRKASEIEIQEMEDRLNILATTGSTGPFIGLFGTVWGIMNAFHQIGATGAASLAVVAPGVSEALITTAIGLVAAIPAVVCYNYFRDQIRREEIEINNFCADFLNIAKRNFFRER